MRKYWFVCIVILLILGTAVLPGVYRYNISYAQRPTISWGSTGQDVRDAQNRLSGWGYYQGAVDGVFGPLTHEAVLFFQRRNGLTVDGIVGQQTWNALGLGGTRQVYTATTGVSTSNEENLLARLVYAEARGEPYTGQVAVAAVTLNRVRNASFPNTLAGVVYQPLAFESVANGQINLQPDADSLRAARQALNGWDPTYGAIYFWNPAKPVNPWIWSRQIITRIGNHVFGI